MDKYQVKEMDFATKVLIYLTVLIGLPIVLLGFYVLFTH
jgi:hypothetical protein